MAKLLQVTAVALGLAGVADLATVMDELMREGDPAALRDDLHQLLLDFFGGLGLGEPKAAGDAEDVGVDHDALGFTEADAENHVGGLSGCAGDGDEFGKGLWNLAAEVRDNFAGRTLDGFGFVAEKARGADQGFKLGQCSLCHSLRSGKAAEELRRNHVDAGVGALGGEDGRDEQLARGVVDEGAFDVGVGLVQCFEDGGYAIGSPVAI